MYADIIFHVASDFMLAFVWTHTLVTVCRNTVRYELSASFSDQSLNAKESKAVVHPQKKCGMRWFEISSACRRTGTLPKRISCRTTHFPWSICCYAFANVKNKNANNVYCRQAGTFALLSRVDQSVNRAVKASIKFYRLNKRKQCSRMIKHYLEILLNLYESSSKSADQGRLAFTNSGAYRPQNRYFLPLT